MFIFPLLAGFGTHPVGEALNEARTYLPDFRPPIPGLVAPGHSNTRILG